MVFTPVMGPGCTIGVGLKPWSCGDRSATLGRRTERPPRWALDLVIAELVRPPAALVGLGGYLADAEFECAKEKFRSLAGPRRRTNAVFVWFV